MWKEKTNRGRVVYDRARHGFTCNDFNRIQKTMIEKVSENLPRAEKLIFYACILAVFQNFTVSLFTAFRSEGDEAFFEDAYREMTSRLSAGGFKGFGGGLFGGAGATR